MITGCQHPITSCSISAMKPMLLLYIRGNIQKFELIHNKMVADNTFNVSYRDKDFKNIKSRRPQVM